MLLPILLTVNLQLSELILFIEKSLITTLLYNVQLLVLGPVRDYDSGNPQSEAI